VRRDCAKAVTASARCDLSGPTAVTVSARDLSGATATVSARRCPSGAGNTALEQYSNVCSNR
jgi:hypothetical protein